MSLLWSLGILEATPCYKHLVSCRSDKRLQNSRVP